MVKGKLASKHSDLQPTRIKKDEDAVSAVVDVIKGWNNPFTENQQGFC
jgi:hypothetical protein